MRISAGSIVLYAFIVSLMGLREPAVHERKGSSFYVVLLGLFLSVYLLRPIIGDRTGVKAFPLFLLGVSFFSWLQSRSILRGLGTPASGNRADPAGRPASDEHPDSDSVKLFRNYGLSSREIDIVDLLNNGYSNKMISEELCISLNTVKTHIKNIFGKIGVKSRLELVIKLQNHPKG